MPIFNVLMRLGAPVARAMLERMGWRAGRVLVLMYHRVHPEPHALNVSPEGFESQIRFLRECCHPLSLSEVVDALRHGRPLPPRAVVVTFDDGYRDNYQHAFPILQRYEVPATFFVTSGMIQAGRYFWWDQVRLGLEPPEVVAQAWPAIADSLLGQDRAGQIALVTEALKQTPHRQARELIARICRPVEPTEPVTMTWDEIRHMAAAGMEIGSHTVTHPILAQQAPEEAAWEVRASKETIERELGMPVRHFAYPNGRACDFSPELIAQLEASGYESAWSTIEGAVTRESPCYALERVGVYHDPRLARFVRELVRVLRPIAPAGARQASEGAGLPASASRA